LFVEVLIFIIVPGLMLMTLFVDLTSYRCNINYFFAIILLTFIVVSDKSMCVLWRGNASEGVEVQLRTIVEVIERYKINTGRYPSDD